MHSIKHLSHGYKEESVTTVISFVRELFKEENLCLALGEPGPEIALITFG